MDWTGGLVNALIRGHVEQELSGQVNISGKSELKYQNERVGWRALSGQVNISGKPELKYQNERVGWRADSSMATWRSSLQVGIRG